MQKIDNIFYMIMCACAVRKKNYLTDMRNLHGSHNLVDQDLFYL